ncbi:MAG: hypothetical protein US54_C0068G0010 [Candidatus Roizmanbacteria bacterium GW2011_GWA2_37_7]|uniref:O-antigen ligase-related domain-containing protein n=1 Tax=Candidatus Roizmanbacteria bacterium GW2011_GWA2_37_7 TaxID=1618481 RepID=A0A0G0K705_9BACT|nr:MAG: hypothetical protein US54_C0068G0010 [Candidatus Roizmanbacteria bacterium GW2011_GWA2_37_7]
MIRFVKLLFYCTLALYGFGQLGRIHLPDQPIYFYAYELGMAIMTIVLMIQYKTAPLKNYSIKHPIILFFVWMEVTLFISYMSYTQYENIIAFLYAFRLIAYGVFFGYFVYYVKLTNLKLFFPITITIIWFFLSSFLQYILYPNIGNIAYLGWDPHVFRVVGVFLDPPIAAGIFFLSGWFLAEQLFQKKIQKRALSVLLLTGILIILTYSRGAILALFGVMVLYGLVQKKYLGTVLSVVTIVVLVLLIPKAHTESINLLRTTSITARITDYSKGIEIWRKNPIFGIGYNHIRFEKEKYIDEVFVEDYNPSHGIASFHSSFLNVLATGGVVGLSLFVYLILFFARRNQFTLICIGFLSILSLFDNVFLHPFIIFFLCVLFIADIQSSRAYRT